MAVFQRKKDNTNPHKQKNENKRETLPNAQSLPEATCPRRGQKNNPNPIENS